MEYIKKFTDSFETILFPGYLLWGPRGRGKTFAAACAVNALIDQGIPAVMRSLSDMATDLAALDGKGQQEYLDDFFSKRMVCIDDISFDDNYTGILRLKKMVMERWSRYDNPSIITTSYTMAELKNPKNKMEEAVFGKMLDHAIPIHVAGPDLRAVKAEDRLIRMRSLFGIQ